MKNLLSLLFATFVAGFVHGQTSVCESAYMPFREGVSFEMTSYNPKGKVTGSVRHQVTGVDEAAGGYRATIQTQLYDDKGKPTLEGGYGIDCTGEGIVVDVSSLLNEQTLAAFSAMEVRVTGDGLQIPNTLSPGQELPDASMQMAASIGGISLLQLNMQITNRKVTTRETITTPAGTFECMKLVQTTSIDGLGKSTYDSTSWFAKGVGTVRTENYDKKGDLSGYSELTVLQR